MAKTGRNAPCPCGSGKKYKHCCAKAEREGVAAGIDREALRSANHWEVEALPMMATVDEDATKRPVLALVAGAGFVLYANVILVAESEADAVARWLADALAKTMRSLDAIPREVHTLGDDVAAALGTLLAERGTPLPVFARDDLPAVDAFLASGREANTPIDLPRLSAPVSWAAWGLPEEAIAALFSAAAELWRRRPWEITGERPFKVAAKHGSWWAVALGDAGEAFGLVLYEHLEDLISESQPGLPEEIFARMTGRIVTLNLDPGYTLHKVMRREVARAGWEVAHADAYPSVTTFRLPGGGLPLAVARDLIDVLGSFPDAAEHSEGAGGGTWEHPESGLSFACPPDEDLPWLAPPPEHLQPGLPSGEGADPELLLRALEEEGELDPEAPYPSEDLAGFGASLREEGLAEPTVRRHEGNVEELLLFLHGMRVPLEALHLKHLWEFLYDYYPRKGPGTESGRRTLRGSLRRFFAFLEERHRIALPWAEELLADADTFEDRYETAPEGMFWDRDVILWRSWTWDRLRDRVLLPGDDLGEDATWGPEMGLVEAQLHDELGRRWLLWRDEVIVAGTTDRDAVIDELLARQLRWETSPHPRCAPRSPYKAILREREERARRRR